jgi:hypothetical protein
MTTIQRSADCGNSPKNKLVEDLAIALETGAPDIDALAGDVRWNRADGDCRSGSAAVSDSIAGTTAPGSLVIERVSSHGKVGSALGRADNRTFAHFFEFASAAAKSVVRIDSFSKAEL